MNISDKSVNGYAENKLARKIAPWYAMIASWAIAPFIFIGFLRYKKRYVIFPILFLITIILMSYFFYYDNADLTISREYYSYLREVKQSTIEYMDYKMAKEMSSYEYMVDISEEYYNLDKRDRADCISFINDIAESDNQIYSLKVERSYVIETDVFPKDYYGHSIVTEIVTVSEAPIKVNSLADDATFNEITKELDSLSTVLELWKEEGYRIKLYNEGYYSKTDDTNTVFNEATLAKIKKYEISYKKQEGHQYYLVYALLFMSMACGVAFAAMVTMSTIANKKIKQVEQVEKEVLVGRGKSARKAFVQQLCTLSRERNAEEFNHVVTVAHTDYELRKDIILTKPQMKALVQEIAVASAILDGKQAAKDVRKRLGKLYDTRNFEQISEITQTYRTRLNLYKENLLKDQSTDCVLEYDGKSTFDGTVLQRLGWTLLCNFVTVITLGIAYPITLCWKMRWQAKHTIYDGKRLSFDGKGVQLLGKWILWGLLTIVTLGIYGLWVAKKLEQWKAKHTHVAGEFTVLGGTFDGSVAGNLCWKVLTVLLSVLTLGIMLPFVMCWKAKWLCRHRVYDGKRLAFDGNGAQLIGKYMLWWLLTVVTLGVYGLWVPNKILKWQAIHTTLNETTECVM